MTSRCRSLRFNPDRSDLARPFRRLGATNDEPAVAGKRHRPGTGAQKIGSGWRRAEHKAW